MTDAVALLDDLPAFRRHARDGTLLLGGGAAILLQLADPRIARGVAAHSDFTERPLGRLIGTLDYVYAVGFGGDDLARFASAEVDARHRPVHGRAADGTPAYSAFDADAQRWVASTLLRVGLDLAERLDGGRGVPDGDAVVRAYGVLGGRLQATRAGWPTDRAEFDHWWRERVERLEVGEDARRVARALLAEPALPRPARLALPPVRLVTAALLPEPVREAYGFRWTPRVARAAEGWLAAVARVRPFVPAPVRELPLHAALRRVERRSRYADE